MTAIEEHVVEGIVRWYVLNGGRSGTLRPVVPGLSDRRQTFNEWTVRDRIGLVLAEARPRLPAGNPYHADATITAVERAVIAEVAYNEAIRYLNRIQGIPMSVLIPCRDLDNAMADANAWYRLMKRCRSHPTWPEAMLWLRRAFGQVAEQDKSFLAHLTS